MTYSHLDPKKVISEFIFTLQVYAWMVVFTLPALLILVSGFIIVLFDVDHMLARRIPDLNEVNNV